MSSQEKSNPGQFLVRSRCNTYERDNDIENEIASEAGDIGDRALHSNRTSQNGSPYLSFDGISENGVALPVVENTLFQPYEFSSPAPNATSNVSPLPKQHVSPSSVGAKVQAEDQKHNNRKELPKVLEYASCLIHLAVFGIFGVLTRYFLQKLFGPGGAGVTNEGILYSDLPSNMVGSFLMGWLGVVFKADISRASDFLAIGLSTGYLGSLTTFSGWNQKMIELSFQGHWFSCLLGFLIGLFLAAYSIIFGIETAKGFRQLLEKRTTKLLPSSSSSQGVESYDHRLPVMVVFLMMLGLLWSTSGVMVREEFSESVGEAQLWLACIVGPFGVWIRWFLARLNGRGLGEAGLLKWIPFGTLFANVSAACLMASLSTLKKEANNRTCDVIATGIQFGLSGCLSTVSTFIAEFNAMRESKHPWRAYAYAMITICISFGLGTLIYSLPV